MRRNYKLRPSHSLATFCFILCFSALTALWLLPLPKLALLVLACGVVIWGGHCLLFDAYLRMGQSCVAFRLEKQEEIVLVLRNGKHEAGHLSQDSLVTPFVIILNVVLSGRRTRRSVLILPDTMGVDSYRRLRVALKWGDKADQGAI